MGNLTCTASGSVANFYTPYAVPIRSFKVHFSPKQSGSGDPSPSNVRPIEGWTGVTGYRCGKNLFGENENYQTGKYIDELGRIGNDGGWIVSDYIRVNPNTEYHFQPNTTSGVGGRHAFYTADKTFISVINSGSISFITPSNCYWMRFSYRNASYDIQLELGSKSTPYEPYHCDEIPISFGNLGTIYGGYVDLVTGDVVEEYGRYVFTGSEDDLISYSRTVVSQGIERNNFHTRALDRIIARTSTNSSFCSNALKFSSGNANTPIIFYVGTPSKQITFYIDSTLCDPTAESFCEWLSNNNMEFVYLLDTPITHTLSPQTLSTLVHSNAFWSNADSVEIEYDLAECGDIKEIRRRILLNTPHLETASGSVAHFKTDMAAKLKECRVNFLPQQAGSGDPSPSNVRAISGWTGLDVVRSGKNIVEVLGYSARNINSKTATRYLTNFYGTTISTTDFSLPDTSVTITQSQWPNDTYHYANGYMCVAVDNIMFEKRYNVSFRITNITNNPLNVDISAIRLISLSSGSYRCVAIGDRLCFNNVLFSRHTSIPDKSEFEIRICGMSFTLSEFMVTPVEDEDYTYAPYDPDKITVSWDNLGTIYGGFIDVLRGELVQEYSHIVVDGVNVPINNVYTGTADRYRWYTPVNSIPGLDYGAGKQAAIMASNMPCTENGSSATTSILPSIDAGGLSAQFYISVPRDYPGTIEDANAWLQQNPIDVVYKLATPITYPLSPEIIKAIKGINNVFSDANGDVSVKYWTH